MPSVPQFLGHNNISIYLRRRRIDVCCVMQECCRKFPSRISPENSWWAYFYGDGKKRFPITSQALLFLSDLEGVIIIHSRLLYNHPNRTIPNGNTGGYKSREGGCWVEVDPYSCKQQASFHCFTRPTRPTPRPTISPPPPNALHPSPPSPVGHEHEVDAAVPPQPGREGPLSRLCCGGLLLRTFVCCVFFAFVAIHPSSRPWLCVSPHARHFFTHHNVPGM